MIKIFKFSIIFTLNIVFVLGLTSCLESVDLMTENVKTGGLIDATYALQYKPASTESVDVDILIYKGPKVKSVKIYKKFSHFIDDGGSISVSESADVLLRTVTVVDDNSVDTAIVTETFSWLNLATGIPQLPDGYNVPEDPTSASIGDYFTLSYVSVLEDGREVSCLPQTFIVVANFFAGYYQSYVMYSHPTLGDRDFYLEKELFTISSSECTTLFAIFEDAQMNIKINADNSITFKRDTIPSFNDK
ncbi:MAG TPA: hypothetical protein PK758_15510, partial [Tenuifilaceae bacterium]|nr:hypothetical protein [Tenuifilaceae bacterium]